LTGVRWLHPSRQVGKMREKAGAAANRGRDDLAVPRCRRLWFIA